MDFDFLVVFGAFCGPLIDKILQNHAQNQNPYLQRHFFGEKVRTACHSCLQNRPSAHFSKGNGDQVVYVAGKYN